jgi:pimeloyl-ACP methyl ester carboxylesterase
MLLVVCLALALLVLGLVGFTAATARGVEARLPPRGVFVEIGGERLHYLDTGGAGPTVVMIHGLGGNLLNFDYALARRLAGDFRLILVDRPGSGYSTRGEQADASVNAQAATLAAFIGELKLGKPLIVGHSLGGAVSLALALHHRDCVGGLVLFAPVTHPIQQVPPIFRGLMIRSGSVRKLVAWTVATPLGLLNERATRKFVFAPDDPAPDFDTRAGGALVLRPKAFASASADAVAVSDSPAIAQNVKLYRSLDVPVAMMFGERDRLLDPSDHAATMKALVPALDLEMTDGGHMLPLTAPDRCAAMIRRVAAGMAERAPLVTFVRG